MAYTDFLSSIHKSTKRDYLARVNEFPKAEAAKMAKEFGEEYWDGDRRWGYGGYRYDGRWNAVAKAFAEHYQLRAGQTVLDVGCGKGFLLYDLTKIVPGIIVKGIDISQYALENAKEEIRGDLTLSSASKLPFEDRSFDFVFSLNTLHNLYTYELYDALKEIERVGRKNKYICVESYRNEEEKVNLMYWQLTCEIFCTPKEWEWWFEMAGYTGDHSFIYFE